MSVPFSEIPVHDHGRCVAGRPKLSALTAASSLRYDDSGHGLTRTDSIIASEKGMRCVVVGLQGSTFHPHYMSAATAFHGATDKGKRAVIWQWARYSGDDTAHWNAISDNINSL
jgi:hypothetical protein